MQHGCANPLLGVREEHPCNHARLARAFDTVQQFDQVFTGSPAILVVRFKPGDHFAAILCRHVGERSQEGPQLLQQYLISNASDCRRLVDKHALKHLTIVLYQIQQLRIGLLFVCHCDAFFGRVTLQPQSIHSSPRVLGTTGCQLGLLSVNGVAVPVRLFSL